MSENLDLSTIFKAVTSTLAENKDTLNNADTYNHDHGDHMVEIFNLVQKSVGKKKSAEPSEQLAYASKQLSKKATSGSAKVYAEGLQKAAVNLKGKQLSTDTIGTLIQSMMGMQEKPAPTQSNNSGILGSLLSGITGNTQQEQPSSSEGNLLGSLLSGITGSQEPKEEPSSNILGSLLSGLTGQKQEDDGKFDISDLLSAGLAFYSAKQQGGSNIEAIMKALISSSPLGQSSHRTQSGALIIDTILGLLKGNK